MPCALGSLSPTRRSERPSLALPRGWARLSSTWLRLMMSNRAPRLAAAATVRGSWLALGAQTGAQVWGWALQNLALGIFLINVFWVCVL